jgi:hypothetical protein
MLVNGKENDQTIRQRRAEGCACCFYYKEKIKAENDLHLRLLIKILIITRSSS